VHEEVVSGKFKVALFFNNEVTVTLYNDTLVEWLKWCHESVRVVHYCHHIAICSGYGPGHEASSVGERGLVETHFSMCFSKRI